MIRIALIPPANQLFFAGLGDMHLILAQKALKNDSYSDFYHEQPLFKILDNGLYEGQQVSIQQLSKVATLVEADEIVLPDVLYDYKKTVASAKRFLLGMHAKHDYQYMAVPQGNTAEQWMQCLHELLHIEGVTTIGLSCLSIPRCWPASNLTTSRLRCLQDIAVSDYFNYDVKWHLLGLRDAFELQVAQQVMPYIRSCDTATPFILGYHKTVFDEGRKPHKVPQTELDSIITMNNEQLACTYNNIAQLHKYSKGC